MELSAAELKQLHDDGYVVLPGVIPDRLCQRAIRRINRYLATANMAEEGQNYKYMAQVGGSDEILDLYRATPVPGLVRALLGPHADRMKPMDKGHMALRFPAEDCLPGPIQSWHLDSLLRGDGAPTSSGPGNFTLLVGVFLSDVSTAGRGNFTVRPGGHRVLAEFFRQHGTDAGALATAHLVDLAPPREVCVPAGGVVFCHHQLPHGASPNLSAHIRYTTFFRVHRDGPLLEPRAMTDPFFEWDAVARHMSPAQDDPAATRPTPSKAAAQ